MTISRDSDTFRRWTESAIECYNRRCHCKGCSLERYCSGLQDDMFYRTKPMKYAVLVLFALYGAPKRRTYEREGIECN